MLGDKDNHVASVHLMQMLYLWPYITFFSIPVLLPSLVANLLPILPSSITRMLPKPMQAFSSMNSPLPRLIVVVPLLAITLVAIHYNTIIHPFTLADNRHYTFYVFRLLTRYPWTKYLVAPVYLFLGWACIGALGGVQFAQGHASPGVGNKSEDITRKARSNSSGNGTNREEVRVSFLILWLLTSTLALASTPLVEPRYFIIPWMIWRLQVPLDSISGFENRVDQRNKSTRTKIKTWIDRLFLELSSSYALYLETFWLLFINLVTGYMFLYKGFNWPSEPGTVQRFMW